MQKTNETESNTEQNQDASLSHNSSDLYVGKYGDSCTQEDISGDSKDIGDSMQDDSAAKALKVCVSWREK